MFSADIIATNQCFIMKEELSSSYHDRVSSLESQVINLQREMAVEKKARSDFKKQQELEKYLVALQDFNRFHKWEKTYPHMVDSLFALRQTRLGNCHYLFDDDDNDMRVFKEILL